MQTIIFYSIAILLLLISFKKDRGKSKLALLKAWNTFRFIFPEMIGIMLLVGFVLSITKPEFVSRFIGNESGFLGIMTAIVLGSVSLIPGFIAFPMTATLLNHGAGISQLAGFISALMMVGVISLPIEIKFFGRKAAVLRNVITFFFSIAVALIMGSILG